MAMTRKQRAELMRRYRSANARVDTASDAREEAIYALIDADHTYRLALECWSPLYDKVKALSPEATDETSTDVIH